jgi:hypothetical protein
LTIAYTFDDPTAAGAVELGDPSGNIPALSGGQSSMRRFSVPGTYRWVATAAGGPAPWPGQQLTGTIVVK